MEEYVWEGSREEVREERERKYERRPRQPEQASKLGVPEVVGRGWDLRVKQTPRWGPKSLWRETT